MRHPVRHTLRRATALLALPLASVWSLAPRLAEGQTTLLDFEGLGYYTPGAPVLWSGGPIVDQHAGLTWTSFRPLDLRNYPLHRPDPDPTLAGGSGYPDAPRFGNVLGLGFGPMVVRSANPYATFRFDDGFFGSGWTDPVALTITGRLDGATLFSQLVSLDPTTSSFLDFPDLLLDELLITPDFLPAGYTDPYGSNTVNGGAPFQTFWMDNVTLTVQAVPEPGTLALVAGGVALAAAVSRRRRRR